MRRGILAVLQLGRQPGQGLGAVLVLGTLFLTLDDDPGRQVSDADRRVGLVDVLAAGARGAVGVDAQVGRIDFHGRLLVRLRQDRHGARRRMDASLGFGLRHTLHTMRAGLELELGVDVVALDAGNHFLVTAVLALALGKDLHAPALFLGVARIHAEQVAGEDRRLVAAGTGTDFQEHVAPVVRVLGQQHALQIGFQGFELRLGLGHFLLGHLAHVGIAVLEQRLGAFEVLLDLAQLAIGDDHRLDLGVFARIGAEAVLVTDDLGIAEQRGELFETVLQDVQLVQQRSFHVFSVPSCRAKSSWAMLSASTRPSAESFFSCTLGACSSLLVSPRAS